MLLGEAHFWTKRDDIVFVPETDYGAFRYHDRKGSFHLEVKKSYTALKKASWNAQNKRGSPAKKDNLKELEELISQQRVVHCVWRNHNVMQILFASGIFAHIRVNPAKGDIEKITLDKYLFGKLAAECVTDVACSREYVVLAYSSNVISLVSLHKPVGHPDKLGRQDPKLLNFELGGPSGRRLERKLSLSLEQNLVLIWWRYSQNEVYPWSPMTKDCDRANLLVYTIVDSKLELKSFYKTEADPLHIAFSRLHPSVILLVEQKVSLNGDVNVESSQFELISGNITRTSPVDVLQLKTEVCSVARSPDEHTLAFGCIDGSVLLHSHSASILVKALFIPYHLVWHPDGTLLMVANEKGQMQCYDLALAPVNFQMLSEMPQNCNFLDLTPYFRGQPHVSNICWNKKPDPEAKLCSRGDGLVFMMFSRGPCAALRVIIGGGLGAGEIGLGPDRLVCMYLSSGLVDCAINLLSCLNWENQGQACLASLCQIVNYLLTKRLTPTIEGQLEASLGTFMSPSVPLSKATEKKFGHTVHNLARKFFRHLLRFSRLDTAFRLAIDIGDYDLFTSIYKSAKLAKNSEIARAAKEKADEMSDDLDSDSSSTTSHCSRSSCSECSSGEHSSSSSPSETKIMEPIVSKNPKVTFSDTVTHIVASSATSAEEDEDDDEDTEVQTLIRSTHPVAPPRPPSLLLPSPNVSGLPVIKPPSLRIGPERPPALHRERPFAAQGPSSYRPPLTSNRTFGSSPSLVGAEPPLNVHIAWKSVTTLTDPRTRTSITQVSEAFETLLMPQASLDLSRVRPDAFAIASHNQPDIRPRVSEVKSLSTLHKQSRQPTSPSVEEVKENLKSKELRVVSSNLNGKPLNAFGPDRNEIGLPLRTFKAVLSEPVDV